MTVTGPDFIALQVSDLERSAEFYENALGLHCPIGRVMTRQQAPLIHTGSQSMPPCVSHE